jgi:hypothetical protein
MNSFKLTKQWSQSLSNSFQQFAAERKAYAAVAFQYLSGSLGCYDILFAHLSAISTSSSPFVKSTQLIINLLYFITFRIIVVSLKLTELI